MKQSMSVFAAIIVAAIFFSGCTTIHKSMREPNVRVELNKGDFTLSGQVTAEAKSVKIIGIDWQRLFMKKTGGVEGGAAGINLANLPVIGNVVSDKTSNYALYELMNTNPGYDVIFYPQYETKVVKPIIGIGFFSKTTTVKTTARLGKLNN